MAKIDTSKIENFDSMSDEEKIKALQDFDFTTSEELEDELKKAKKANDKLSSENAELKRQKKKLESEKADDDDAHKTEIEKLTERIDEMVKVNSINEYKASFIAQGYSEELALDTAKASVDGDIKKIMANQKKFLEEHDKKVIQKAMTEVKSPKGTEEKYKDMTLEKFRKLSSVERAEYSKNYPEEYQSLYTK